MAISLLKIGGILTSRIIKCGFCRSVLRYNPQTDLSWVSDHPPYHGLKCPHCEATIFLDGSRNSRGKV